MKLRSKWLILIILIACILAAFVIKYVNQQGAYSYPAGEPFVLPQESNYEVVVVGGEPEGIAAALAAARSGKRTLLIEKGPALGGLWTLGRLNFLDMNYGPDGALLTQGIFQEFYAALGDAFDINTAMAYFATVTSQEFLLDVALNTDSGKPAMRENNANQQILYCLELDEGRKVYGERFIDATADGDLAAACGVPFTMGGEDYGQQAESMAATLVFNIKDVHWSKVFLHNNWQRLLNRINDSWGDGQAGAKLDLAWGYGREALNYQAKDAGIRLRGPNLAKLKNGDVLLNALLIFDVDPFDEQSISVGIQRGKAEIPFVLQFMQENFVGFKKAQLVDTASRLYIRESRHMLGEYRLTIGDVLENRDHWDRIAHGSYPVDIQPTAPDSLGDVIGKPVIYSIPFRCLVPINVEHLLIVGRSASYDSLAHGSARVVPIGIAAGEAAGIAAGISLEKQIDFRQLSRNKILINELQQELINRGAYLKEFVAPEFAVMSHWAYDGLVMMRELGLASGGYNNDYQLDKNAEYWDIQRVLTRVQTRLLQLVPNIEFGTMKFDDTPLTRRDMLTKISQMLQLDLSEEPEKVLLKQDILDLETLERMQPLEQKPSFGELYWLGARIFSIYSIR